MFDEWVFDFHNLHSLSPLRGSHKKIAGLYRFFRIRPYPSCLTYIKQSDLETKKPETRLRF
ncbi:hypothetical protein DKC09_24530 [Klebsiella quasipneumoniae]|uniref:Uncharacterized protein n=1 Tax=Klebsiella quasipneumoniae TaxID=1463165 RepID=A0AAI8ITI9_9ENTR|nr:hypothetical protein DKC11_20855 [Klebsiella quasipneumoniae]AWL62486.1 hypothetical protein DKC00_12310 [Klebsiella quasipneumoniae]AWL76062.1 hypothetical protein DKC09_24530 [Klebsiella quasipneumoniae]